MAKHPTDEVNAREFVGTGFPTNEGAKLATVLLKRPTGFDNLTVDLTALPAALLISAFFNAFLQHIYKADAARLPKARAIHWKAQFPFQEENIARWMKDFSPNTTA